jgi:phosphoribosylformylglycinamidine cyclo-ligase
LSDQNWKLSQTIEGETLGEALLKPTELYVKRVLKLFDRLDIKACAHITGGGLIENLPRGVVESKVSIVLEKSKIPTTALMRRFVEATKMSEVEAFSTWNMGIGFCVIASERERTELLKSGALEIGRVEARSSSSVILT